RSAALLVATAASLTASGGTLSAQTLAVTGATIIDGTGKAPLRDGVVLITDGRIVKVGTAREVQVPASARTVDARGKFVIPGLMDANLHLFLNGDLETLIKYEGRYDEVVIEGAQIALKSGQTTVFDTWGPRDALIKAREMINSGKATGSRIYLAGNIIGLDGPLSADFRLPAAAFVSKSFAARTNESWEVGTGRKLMGMYPEEVRAAIRTYASSGVDFLKYAASGHTDMNFLTFSLRQQLAIVEEGHRAGKTVQAHVTSPESVDMAVDAGVDILTHGDMSGPTHAIPEETLKKIAAKDVSVSILPITQRRLQAMQQQVPPSMLTPFFAIAQQNIRNMIKHKIRILLSTDAGIANPVLRSESRTLAVDSIDARTELGEGLFNGIVALEELGMEPMEILQSVTSHVAKAYKHSEIGTLEPGKVADLVILDADPLASARNYRRVHAVIKDGKMVDLASLPTAPIISVKPSAK
ncbi:MAG: amidohydrolase family protein, partial [Gemmatimonadota bacterium]